MWLSRKTIRKPSKYRNDQHEFLGRKSIRKTLGRVQNLPQKASLLASGECQKRPLISGVSTAGGPFEVVGGFGCGGSGWMRCNPTAIYMAAAYRTQSGVRSGTRIGSRKSPDRHRSSACARCCRGDAFPSVGGIPLRDRRQRIAGDRGGAAANAASGRAVRDPAARSPHPARRAAGRPRDCGARALRRRPGEHPRHPMTVLVRPPF